MSAPADGDDLEADLGSLSDEDWQEGHARLSGAGIPDEELAHVWDPDLDGDELILAEERVRG